MKKKSPPSFIRRDSLSWEMPPTAPPRVYIRDVIYMIIYTEFQWRRWRRVVAEHNIGGGRRALRILRNFRSSPSQSPSFGCGRARHTTAATTAAADPLLHPVCRTAASFPFLLLTRFSKRRSPLFASLFCCLSRARTDDD